MSKMQLEMRIPALKQRIKQKEDMLDKITKAIQKYGLVQVRDAEPRYWCDRDLSVCSTYRITKKSKQWGVYERERIDYQENEFVVKQGRIKLSNELEDLKKDLANMEGKLRNLIPSSPFTYPDSNKMPYTKDAKKKAVMEEVKRQLGKHTHEIGRMRELNKKKIAKWQQEAKAVEDAIEKQPYRAKGAIVMKQLLERVAEKKQADKESPDTEESVSILIRNLIKTVKQEIIKIGKIAIRRMKQRAIQKAKQLLNDAKNSFIGFFSWSVRT